MNGEPVDDCFVAIIHPDNTYDFTNDPAWVAVKTYSTPEDMYSGEIGKMYGVRFVESTEAKVFHAADLTVGARNLTVKAGVTGATIAVNEAITAGDATALVGRKVLVGSSQYEVASATSAVAGSATITLKTSVTVSSSDIIYPGEAGAKGRDVYSTLVIADNAYGTTEISGGGLEHITKQLGSAGTGDPLNQRATAGWKATKVAKRLVEEYMIRVESCSTFQSGTN
jgi:hypothetical protein